MRESYETTCVSCGKVRLCTIDNKSNEPAMCESCANEHKQSSKRNASSTHPSVEFIYKIILK